MILLSRQQQHVLQHANFAPTTYPHSKVRNILSNKIPCSLPYMDINIRIQTTNANVNAPVKIIATVTKTKMRNFVLKFACSRWRARNRYSYSSWSNRSRLMMRSCSDIRCFFGAACFFVAVLWSIVVGGSP